MTHEDFYHAIRNDDACMHAAEKFWLSYVKNTLQALSKPDLCKLVPGNKGKREALINCVLDTNYCTGNVSLVSVATIGLPTRSARDLARRAIAQYASARLRWWFATAPAMHDRLNATIQ